ncbi:Methyltransferase domain-containing protein [Filimonas lacunae]|uniref:Methyltransferase domain-containing protein n=1 Tax=Filimonas lacunae TaxID=477680 RepID=A0A173MG13_9BACT|nr:class I SAM-dependent methyltransferase [Filimonas lacunae]BAV06420.1 hypothetical protein FLA_2437 [Filimonas lacunae]SIT26889.1 Methyltransferase domain-containing protein [Filimonas lacunae]
MEAVRKPFQGVSNIVRFNWHFYLLSLLFIVLLLLLSGVAVTLLQHIITVLCLLAGFTIIVSLLVSCYIYDLSKLYQFRWIQPTGAEKVVVNINAGFDETSALLENRFTHSQLIVLDFYDPVKHTEVSIKRARKAYPAYPGTQTITTARLPLANNTADKIFLILAAHEIRNEQERIAFFKELRRIVKHGGEICIVEHLRDTANLLAYNIGAFHFHSKPTWHKTFQAANLDIRQEIKLTPFISTFILQKHGDTL